MAVLGGKGGMTLPLVPIAPAQMRLASVNDQAGIAQAVIRMN
ncbi:MAG TPA: hypothetical protein VMS64_22365 [Candidatus Methylomirabilis sp.]|nr:hypothetical protein [Candidatus Methylomirabilis sp.]